jgi:hypothetical protein
MLLTIEMPFSESYQSKLEICIKRAPVTRTLKQGIDLASEVIYSFLHQ